MQTIFDWVTVLLFLATAGTFFFRTQYEQPPLLKYIALTIGCAIANQAGNAGFAIPALLLIGALIGGLVWLGSLPYGASQ